MTDWAGLSVPLWLHPETSSGSVAVNRLRSENDLIGLARSIRRGGRNYATRSEAMVVTKSTPSIAAISGSSPYRLYRICLLKQSIGAARFRATMPASFETEERQLVLRLWFRQASPSSGQMRQQAEHLIQQQRADMQLLKLYSVTADYNVYMTPSFRTNQPNYKWNFGAECLTIRSADVEIEPLSMDAQKKVSLDLVCGVFGGANFAVGGHREHFDMRAEAGVGLHSYLFLDNQLRLYVRYNFGSTAHTIPFSVGSDFERNYKEGYIGYVETGLGHSEPPRVSVNEFHAHPQLFPFLEKASRAITKLVLDRDAEMGRLLKHLDEGRKRKFTF